MDQTQRSVGNANEIYRRATFPIGTDDVIRIVIYESECYCKKPDCRIGNPIAMNTVDALPQINPFHSPIHTIRTNGRLPLTGASRLATNYPLWHVILPSSLSRQKYQTIKRRRQINIINF